MTRFLVQTNLKICWHTTHTHDKLYHQLCLKWLYYVNTCRRELKTRTMSRYLGKLKIFFEFYNKAHITKNMAYAVFDHLILCSLHRKWKQLYTAVLQKKDTVCRRVVWVWKITSQMYLSEILCTPLLTLFMMLNERKICIVQPICILFSFRRECLWKYNMIFIICFWSTLWTYNKNLGIMYTQLRFYRIQFKFS